MDLLAMLERLLDYGMAHAGRPKDRADGAYHAYMLILQRMHSRFSPVLKKEDTVSNAFQDVSEHMKSYFDHVLDQYNEVRAKETLRIS